MREIVVISGKGGTGKTSVSAAFAQLMQKGIVCDLDVDAPDLHIILKPVIRQEHHFLSGMEAQISQEACTACAACAEACRFDAIYQQGESFAVDPLRCEGCAFCAAICPADAISLTEKHCGYWYESESRFGPMIHAQLFPGEENSGKLVSLLKQKAREEARKNLLETILCDGSPGIGCPVISSLSGAHLAVIVLEPTPSGQHDFMRVAELCKHFRIPACVIINKADLNSERSATIEKFCREKGYPLMARLPFSQDVTRAMIAKRTLVESASPLAETITQAWKNILEYANSGLRRPIL
jgi:MinD superfamily P-loop ATPase